MAWIFFRALQWRVLGRLCGLLLLLYGGAIMLTPLPELAVRALENRFATPVEGPQVAGIIVLGGATDSGQVAAARGQPMLNGAAERLTTAIALHRAMPERPLIVTGYSGRLIPSGLNEAEITRLLFQQQGLSLSQVRFEARSRNTAENARLSAELAGDEERPWLLITSAWHMPRAVASFRAAGLSVVPHPVDFRTEPDTLMWPREPDSSLGLAYIALHEWLGLLAYYVTGRTTEFLPAPQPL
ncbi:YdcF family protein [Pelagibius litoralis]|uniref:YdcF family protein n=1 Tax=Pelagibius litoralis TaxID=374515 RepID=A0A967EX06_9PROT|nr:YdcF family protein [Pelagibius litoralis]NIA67055.1 YdcF family protein [Pelagibius litoralis]